jgi:hypothetical protein
MQLHPAGLVVGPFSADVPGNRVHPVGAVPVCSEDRQLIAMRGVGNAKIDKGIPESAIPGFAVIVS